MDKFHTCYDAAELINKDKIYDDHDNVDRLSYVDNTAMVKRFVMEGKSLAQARAAALRSGAYSGNLNEIENDHGIPVPVYGMDPVVSKPMIDAAMEKFGTPAVAAAEVERSGADAAAYSGVTEASSASDNQ